MKKEKTSVLLPTAYLPPISYFVALLNCDYILIEQYETYPKQTYRNRCEILTANEKLSLSIPVTKPDGNKTLTRDVDIFYGGQWQLNHWRAIKSAYLSSPYFIYYQDDFEIFYNEKHIHLLEFNTFLLKTLMRIIGLEKDINLTNEYVHQPDGIIDLRTVISPKKPVKEFLFTPYTQVFSDRHSFNANLSIIDLLFNIGPDSLGYLTDLNVNIYWPDSLIP